MVTKKSSRAVYIVDGSRTPFLKARGVPGPFTASDLAVNSGRQLLARQPFDPAELDEVILGCIMPGADEANIARVASLRLGCGKHVTAWTVQRNCASGMQSIDCAAQNIVMGRSDLVLAGGTEAMSYAPLLFSKAMATWFGKFSSSRDVASKLRILARFRPALLIPVNALLKGLSGSCRWVIHGSNRRNYCTSFFSNTRSNGCLRRAKSSTTDRSPGTGSFE